MSITDTVIRAIACDAPECTKQVLFDRKEEKQVFENPENIWLKSTRVVQSADGRNLVYCSDVCEVKGAETGKHNIPEAPRVHTVANPAAIAAAAQAAANARNAEAAIRGGQPANIQIAQS
jgi:hypothetical protein